jgi:hypothetical protein
MQHCHTYHMLATRMFMYGRLPPVGLPLSTELNMFEAPCKAYSPTPNHCDAAVCLSCPAGYAPSAVPNRDNALDAFCKP